MAKYEAKAAKPGRTPPNVTRMTKDGKTYFVTGDVATAENDGYTVKKPTAGKAKRGKRVVAEVPERRITIATIRKFALENISRWDDLLKEIAQAIAERKAERIKELEAEIKQLKG